MKIQTKPFCFGNDKESSWPPLYGSGDKTPMYWDKESNCLKAGHPPPRKVFANAPYVITDTIEEYYHPKACVYVDSKSKLRRIDDACGTITTDKKIEPDPSWQNEQRRLRHEDGHKALHKAVAQIDAGTAPLTEEMRAKCEQQNEIVSSALNIDAFNIVGKKNNAKGKKYRRKR